MLIIDNKHLLINKYVKHLGLYVYHFLINSRQFLPTLNGLDANSWPSYFAKLHLLFIIFPSFRIQSLEKGISTLQPSNLFRT